LAEVKNLVLDIRASKGSGSNFLPKNECRIKGEVYNEKNPTKTPEKMKGVR